MTALDRITDALRNHGSKVTTTGGRTMAQCPAHEDRTPSLAVTGIAGSVLMHCHAGCTADDVLDALKLGKADLYDEPRPGRVQGIPAHAIYTYDDGRQVIRSADKEFKQGGNTRGNAIYHLAQVIAAVKAGQTIHLVEGEKDVHAIESLGGVATTAASGSNVHKADLSPLHGAHVVAVVDVDDAGDRWAAKVREALDGRTGSLTFVHAATGKDAADHIAAGHSLDELTPITVDPSIFLDVVTAADVTLRRVRYLWEQRIPLGAMTLMPGEEGIGKTTVGVRLIAELTRGTLSGEHHGTPQDVIVLATEDGLEDVFVPRLHEAGADLGRVRIIRASIGLDGDHRSVIVPRDLAAIGLLVRKHNAAMVYIDSLVTTLPDELKSISYKDTAKVLKALGGWAEAERVAVIAPWHLNKTSGSDTALRIMDSRAFRTAVRSMLLVVPDPDAPEGVTQGIVALDKANAGTLDVPALRYRIRSATYTLAEVDEQTGEVKDVTASCGVADWIGEVEGDGRQIARDALAPAVEKEGSPTAWLRDYLTGEGETARSDVIAAAQEDGISLSGIKRAAASLRVHSRDETGQAPNGRPYRRSLWSLPQSAHQSAHTELTEPSGPTGETSTDPIDPYMQVSPSRPSRPSRFMGGPTEEKLDPLRNDTCTCGRTIAPGRAIQGHTQCQYCIEDAHKESA